MSRQPSPPRAFKKVRGMQRMLKRCVVYHPPSSHDTVASNVHSASGSALRSTSILAAPQQRPHVAPKAPDTHSSDNASVAHCCSSCGDTMFTDSWDKCTMCRLKALSQKDVPRKDTRPALLPAISATNAVVSSSAAVPVSEPKPRQRLTKKMREREFDSWFSRWTEGYRENPELRGVAKDKGDYWRDELTRKEGGTVYPNIDTFFSALRMVWVDQQLNQTRGGTQVLAFHGAYSIVAQPRIHAHNRHEKIRERMRQMGFKLDTEDLGTVAYLERQKPDDDSVLTCSDAVYKYPCCCGGSNPRQGGSSRPAHRMPDSQCVGPCGGTVMILVGRDYSLRPYRIFGQRIAVDIVH
ncbi:hypothetical protein K466DRAFT_586203 [Polyporus arcularius HHB13444]|uniref:Uncharacterized protein n=1 Tax=Polyporus arcularius HHB13444 TaxID=1314778 RepID=A0A5C3PD04_9APHY|nr:hypothetical protein K466DRAFT_586203 [Polyporus arcularius HHB13444]